MFCHTLCSSIANKEEELESVVKLNEVFEFFFKKKKDEARCEPQRQRQLFQLSCEGVNCVMTRHKIGKWDS